MRLANLPRLYKDDLEFARVAFDELAGSLGDFALPEFHPSRPEFSACWLRKTCAAAASLCRRKRSRAIGASGLTTDRKRVMKAIAEARKRKGEWPQEQLVLGTAPGDGLAAG